MSPQQPDREREKIQPIKITGKRGIKMSYDEDNSTQGYITSNYFED